MGVARSHSRPHVSNDNPYSEAQFKTLKYCPRSPDASGRSNTHARSAPRFSITTTMCTATPGIGLHAPASVHYGTAGEIRSGRARTLDDAYAANQDRFRGRRPERPALPTIAWSNGPNRVALIKSA